MNVKTKTVSQLISIICKVDEMKALAMVSEEKGLAGLYGVDSAKIETHKGFGKKKAEVMEAAIELAKRLQSASKHHAKKISDAIDVWNLLGHEMKFLQVEEFRVILLGGRNEVLSIETIAVGQRNQCAIVPQDIFRAALIAKASNIILVHNHPSGDSSPSPEDCAMTRKVTNTGDLLGIKCLDHIIIGSDSHTSLRQEGLIH